MEPKVLYWINKYEKLKKESVCLDIEWASFNGDISIVGLYTPKEGLIECQTLIKGKNLTRENLASALSGKRLIITFNGLYMDIKTLNQQFPEIIPRQIPIFDLYLFSRKINFGASLRTLENTFNIERLTSHSEKKGIAIKLWQAYLKGDKGALVKLIEYNKQDTINLYPLAEKLVKIAKEKG